MDSSAQSSTPRGAVVTGAEHAIETLHLDGYRPLTTVDSIGSLVKALLDVMRCTAHGNVRDDVNAVIDENGRGVVLDREPVVGAFEDESLYKPVGTKSLVEAQVEAIASDDMEEDSDDAENSNDEHNSSRFAMSDSALPLSPAACTGTRQASAADGRI
ncbi:BQ2448_998 [Microbotryum intermedium]|uniref:BQ2448_998 protein n=1 Tax=Microbotryum intermedium TaxID=269621 RepID=A0A238F6U7_9BASI|nr:BQ2448_998 [Microbotryum intermedium]